MTGRVKDLWHRSRTAPVWAIDALLATGLVVISLLTVNSDPIDPDVVFEPLDVRAYLILFATTLPYYVRRRAPFTVFAWSTAGLCTFSALGYYEGALPFAVLVGIYTVGAYRPPRAILAAFGVLIAAMAILVGVGAPNFSTGSVVENSAVFGFALLFGWTVQSRRLRLEAAEERAELLEREQAEGAARAVADERLRIAQELHDVVAHSMSVIAVQAGAGMHVIDQDPAEAKRTLQNISATSRSTLTELRRLLGVLRDDGSGASYAPAPGLDDLDQLAGEVTRAGVPVDVDTDGPLADVPPGVGFTGYRIVQEALTNVLKHAGPSRASVRLEHHPGTLLIDVSDDGRGVNGRAGEGGHGLIGMRERVAVYGGTLEAGPQPGGGYLVRAVLPYEAHEGGRVAEQTAAPGAGRDHAPGAGSDDAGEGESGEVRDDAGDGESGEVRDDAGDGESGEVRDDAWDGVSDDAPGDARDERPADAPGAGRGDAQCDARDEGRADAPGDGSGEGPGEVRGEAGGRAAGDGSGDARDGAPGEGRR